MKYDLSKFPGRLKQARNEKGLTQRQVSEMADINEKVAYQYEKKGHNASGLIMVTLADVLDVSVGWLLGNENKAKMKYDLSKIHTRLRSARKSKNLTPYELAEKSGVSVYCISGTELDYSIPRIGTVAKLANALEVSVDWLCGGECDESDI